MCKPSAPICLHLSRADAVICKFKDDVEMVWCSDAMICKCKDDREMVWCSDAMIYSVKMIGEMGQPFPAARHSAGL